MNTLLRAVTGTVLILAATGEIGSAMMMSEFIAEPCRAKNILAGLLVSDRQTDRDLFVVANTNEETGLEIIFIDPYHNTARLFRSPAGAGAWALNEIAGDRLVIGTHYDGHFAVFDLNKMEFVQAVDFQGESYIWMGALGKDGRLYGGTYPGGKLGALDLEKGGVEDCGAPAAPNLYLRNISALPDGRLVCHFNTESPVTLVYDPDTKDFTPAPDRLNNGLGVSYQGYFLAGTQAYDGKTLEPVSPFPFALPPGEGGWSVEPGLSRPDVVVYRKGNEIYRLPNGASEVQLLTRSSLHGGTWYACAADGTLYGARGPDYVVLKPGGDMEIRPIPVESAPRPIMFLKAAPDGKLWGGPHFGQTLFWLDPPTAEYQNTSKVCDAGGEVYDVAFMGGAVYAASYVRGDIVRYRPLVDWDQWNNMNPRVIVQISKHGYIRPTGGIVLGPDRKLYSGWMAAYGVYGGALAITDPITGETTMMKDPLGKQAVSGVAVNEQYAFLSTNLDGNGLPRKKDEDPHFGVVDLAKREIVFDRPFPGATSVRVVALDKATGRVAVSADGQMMVFDPQSLEFLEDLPMGAPAPGTRSVGAPGDGFVYYGCGKQIIRFGLSDGMHTVLAEALEDVSNVTVGVNGSIFYSAGTRVYRLRTADPGTSK